MIVWKPFLTKPGSPLILLSAELSSHMQNERYVIVTYVPGSGWAGAYGTYEGGSLGGGIEVTELVDDRHVKICALSKPEGPDNPNAPGPNHAA